MFHSHVKKCIAQSLHQPGCSTLSWTENRSNEDKQIFQRVADHGIDI